MSSSGTADVDDGRRATLREAVRAGLPVMRDGSIHLIARAWAVRGYTEGVSA